MRVATVTGVDTVTITGIKEIQSMAAISNGEAEEVAGMTGTIGMIESAGEESSRRKDTENVDWLKS